MPSQVKKMMMDLDLSGTVTSDVMPHGVCCVCMCVCVYVCVVCML